MNSVTVKRLTLLFSVAVAVLSLVAAFTGGLSFNVHHYKDSAVDSLIAVVAALAAAVGIAGYILDIRAAYESELEKSVDQRHDENLTRLLMLAINSVTEGKRSPTQSELLFIENMFHEHTDGHYVKLALLKDTDSNGLSAVFSHTPFEDEDGDQVEYEVPDRPLGKTARFSGFSEAAESFEVPVGYEVDDVTPPETFHPRSDGSVFVPADSKKVPVKIVNPNSKSKQRRINTQKGLGAITDDEVKENKKADRRAKYAAKKQIKSTKVSGTKKEK